MNMNKNNAPRHHVIVHRPHCGFFSDFLQILTAIQQVLARGGEPFIDWRSPVYTNKAFVNTNLFDRYFWQPSDGTGPVVETCDQFGLYGEFYQCFDKDDHGILVGMQPAIQLLRDRRILEYSPFIRTMPKTPVDDFRVLGFHKRGTDHEVKHVPVATWIQWIEEELKRDSYDKVLAITDSDQALNAFQLHFGDMLISTNSYRSPSMQSIHGGCDRDPAGPTGFRLAEDVITDVVALSKCKRMLLERSNVSQAAMLFGAAMREHFGLDQFRYIYREPY